MPPRAPLPMGRHILWGLALIASLAAAACPSPQHERAPVVLTWDYPHPTPTSDGFLVQRRTDTGPWQDVARVAATLRTVTDATAPRNTPLCYQVLAYRGREYSAPSNEVCLTIPAGPQPRARTSPEEGLPWYPVSKSLHTVLGESTPGNSMAEPLDVVGDTSLTY